MLKGTRSGCLMYNIILGIVMNAMSSFSVKVEESFETSTIDMMFVDDRKCPDSEVRFYLYTRDNVDERQLIYIDDTLDASNLSSSLFKPELPNKIIIHGFRADMFLTPLYKMKAEYLQRDLFNIFFVDWFNLSSSFYYPAVVHNIKHVGECTAQLVNRIRDAGGEDIHMIGFSLGAQVMNYVANSLKPDYLLPRITGLDPALPLFVTSDKSHKLDSSDAEFVDVFHCNGLMQGQLERCGHIDFYMNGGIYQPGCASDVLSCSHHRCAYYFMESIQSPVGFYGWKCKNYFNYVFGLCPYDGTKLLLAGEDCKLTARGMFIVATNSKFPYAKGNKTISTNDASPRNINEDELKALKMLQGNYMKDLYDIDKSSIEKMKEKFQEIDPSVVLVVTEN